MWVCNVLREGELAFNHLTVHIVPRVVPRVVPHIFPHEESQRAKKMSGTQTFAMVTVIVFRT